MQILSNKLILNNEDLLQDNLITNKTVDNSSMILPKNLNGTILFKEAASDIYEGTKNYTIHNPKLFLDNKSILLPGKAKFSLNKRYVEKEELRSPDVLFQFRKGKFRHHTRIRRDKRTKIKTNFSLLEEENEVKFSRISSTVHCRTRDVSNNFNL